MPITLWRIHHRDNPRMGLFRYIRDAINEAIEHGHEPWSLPTPGQEGHYPSSSEYCAFASYDQFCLWFTTPEQRAAVLNHPDTIVSCLEVEDAIVLPFQALFEFRKVLTSTTSKEIPACASPSGAVATA